MGTMFPVLSWNTKTSIEKKKKVYECTTWGWFIPGFIENSHFQGEKHGVSLYLSSVYT